MAPAVFRGPGQCCLSRQEPLSPARGPIQTPGTELSPVTGSRAPLRMASPGGSRPASVMFCASLDSGLLAAFPWCPCARIASPGCERRGRSSPLLLPKPGIRRGSENHSSEGSALRRGPYRRAKVSPGHGPSPRPRPASTAPPFISLSPPPLRGPTHLGHAPHPATPLTPLSPPLTPPVPPLHAGPAPHSHTSPPGSHALPLTPRPRPQPLTPPHHTPLPPPPSPLQVSLPCPLTPQPRPLTPAPPPRPAFPGLPRPLPSRAS